MSPDGLYFRPEETVSREVMIKVLAESFPDHQEVVHRILGAKISKTAVTRLELVQVIDEIIFFRRR